MRQCRVSVLLLLLARDGAASHRPGHEHRHQHQHGSEISVPSTSSNVPGLPTPEDLTLRPSGLAAAANVLRGMEWEVTVALTFLLAGCVHAVAGFGSGLVSMAILPLQLPLMDAVPIVATFCLLVVLTLAIRLRHSLAGPGVRTTLPPLLAGAVVGTPLGVLMLTEADPHLLRLVLGGCMLVFVAERALHEGAEPIGGADLNGAAASPRVAPHESSYTALAVSDPAAEADAPDEPAPPKGFGGMGPLFGDLSPLGFATGIISGVLSGALNEGGPPVVIFMAWKRWSKDATQATLQWHFTLLAALSVAMLAQQRLLTLSHVYYVAVGLPFAAAGVAFGVLIYSRIDERLFGRIVCGALLVTGLVYVAKSAAALLPQY